MIKTRGHFFSLPNEIFELRLSPSAFLVYSYLRRSANRNTRQCYPSYETIGAAVGLSKNTVKKCVGELADKGLIFTENTSILTKGGMKLNGNLQDANVIADSGNSYSAKNKDTASRKKICLK